MALQITENKTNIVPYQSGSGTPIHLSPSGSVYVDTLTGTAYINKDGLNNWAYFYDSTLNITGGTISGSFLPLSGGTVTGPTQFTNGITANTIVKSGGTAMEILTADGSVITAGSGITIVSNVISVTTPIQVGSGSGSTIRCGNGNVTSGNYSTVSGGKDNIASGNYSTISGGYTNLTTGYVTSIGGGNNNRSTGDGNFIGGGFNNCTANISTVVVGGGNNTASGNYAFIGGGLGNTASNYGAVVIGGLSNTVSGAYSTASGYANQVINSYSSVGGRNNIASGGYSTISSGYNNHTTSDYSFIGTGGNNIVSSCHNFIGVGMNNCVTASCSSIVGGSNNTVSGCNSFIGGGYTNSILLNNGSVIAGGIYNSSSSIYTSIGGGKCNIVNGSSSTISGGYANTANGSSSTISGGYANTANGLISTVSGGYLNTVSGSFSTVSGGYHNTASAYSSVISGGFFNIACNSYATIAGGFSNTASGYVSSVNGGNNNIASGCFSFIGGGYSNIASGDSSLISGGISNTASGSTSNIGGGCFNNAGGDGNTIGGGFLNTTSDRASTVSGGYQNTASGYMSTISGGYGNNVYGGGNTISGGYFNTICNTSSGGSISGGISNIVSGTGSFIGSGIGNIVSGNHSSAMGYSNCVTGNYSSAIGCGLNASVDKTLYVNNLCVMGGASGIYSTISGSTDVSLTALTNNQLLGYNSSISKWVNVTPNYISGNQPIVLSGVITGSGTTGITTSLSSNVVGISNLTATGTPSSTTYLRGDNTWATISGTISGLTSNQVAFATSASTVSGSTYMIWNNTTNRLGIGNNASSNAAALGIDVSSYATDGYALSVIQSSNGYPAGYFNNNGGAGDILQLVGLGSTTNYFTTAGTIGLGSRDTAKLLYLNRGVSASAPGLNGINLVTGTSTFTDVANVSSATNFAINVLNIPTISNSSFSGTTRYTNSYNLYISGAPVAGSSATITNSYALGVGSGNVVFGTGFNTNANFLVAQPTTGIGTITITSGGVTGVNTQFTNTFKVGDTLSCGGTTYTIGSISSDTIMTVTPTTPTQAAGSNYTLTGGIRFSVKGNGTVNAGSIGATSLFINSSGSVNNTGPWINSSNGYYSFYGTGNGGLGTTSYNGSSAIALIAPDGTLFLNSAGAAGTTGVNGYRLYIPSGINIAGGFNVSSNSSTLDSTIYKYTYYEPFSGGYAGLKVSNQAGQQNAHQCGIAATIGGNTSSTWNTYALYANNQATSTGTGQNYGIYGVGLTNYLNNLTVGGLTTSSLFQVSQATIGLGTITILGTTITGVQTQFTNTFKIGDTLTVTPTTTVWSGSTAYVIGNVVTNGGNMYNVTTAGTGGTGPTGTSTTPTQFGGAGAFFTYVAPTYTISAIASDTSMTISPTATLSAASSYTLTGGAKFQVFGNGNVTWGGSTSTIGGANSKMWWDATNNALNIGTATQQSTYLLNVNGASQITVPNGVTATYALTINSPSGSNLSNGILIGGGYTGNGCIVFNTNGSGHPYGVYNTSGSNVSCMLGGTVTSMCNLTTTSYSLINYSGGILTPSGVNSGGITVNDSSTTPYAFSANRTGSGVFRTYNQVMNSVTFLASTPNNSTLISSYYYSAGNGSVWTQMYEANQFGAILIDNTYLSGAVTKTAFIWSTTSVGVLGERMRLVGDSLLINTTSPDSSSILSIVSNTKGVLLPRMTTTQKTSITSPATGLVLYDTTLNKLCVFTGTVWETVTSV